MSKGKKGRSQDFLIRGMEEDDIEQVVRIEDETFPIPWSYEAFLRENRNPLSMTWVVESEGRVIGYAVALMYSSTLHLANIALERSSRRKGIGSILLSQVEKAAREIGLRKITLEVRRSNKGAQAFYRKNGYRLKDIVKGYYPPKWEDALVFEKVLD